jgi:NAD(P)H-binding
MRLITRPQCSPIYGTMGLVLGAFARQSCRNLGVATHQRNAGQEREKAVVARSAFVVGGTGQIGRAVARALIADGWSVRLAHRGRRPPPSELLARGAEVITLDRDIPGALAAALGPGADAVIDAVAYGPEHADQLLEVQSTVGALVVISSASVYRDAAGRTLDEARVTGFPELPVPVPETQATVEPGPGTYSTRKMALERRLLDRARCPVTVLRPCAIHGPGSQHPREWWFVKRMLDGAFAVRGRSPDGSTGAAARGSAFGSVSALGRERFWYGRFLSGRRGLYSTVSQAPRAGTPARVESCFVQMIIRARAGEGDLPRMLPSRSRH